MIKRRYLSLLAAAALALPAAGLAQQEAGKLYLNPAVGWIEWDSDTNLDDDVYYQLGAEARLTERFGVELRYGQADSVDIKRGTGEADFTRLGLDMLYYFGRFGANRAWEPYLAAGVSHGEFDVDGSDRSDETLGNIGLGVRYHLSDRWSLRADARAVNSFDSEQTHGIYTLGISYALGGSPAPAPAPEPAPEPVSAAPVDSDGDGVPDERDRCPNTPRGREVDEYGCEYVLKQTETIRMEVLFAFDSSEVREEYMDEIEKVARFLRKYGGTTAQIEGHADSIGTDSYNKKLSQERADAVRTVLVERFNIDPARLTSVGYGEERPIADNNTEEGRRENRRVVAVVAAEVEKPRD